jgi:hypothetical protein
MVDQEARKRIRALEAQGVQRDRDIADLSGRLSLLAATVEAIRIEAPGARAPAPAPAVPAPAPAVPAVEELRLEISMLKHRVQLMMPRPPAGFASRINADFLLLFAEFHGKCFTLLWRASSDGFGAREFHRYCDGHANTLALIEDYGGNVFGGFTPVEWESREWRGDGSNLFKADRSRKSFLFTLKNPHDFPARKFALKAEARNQAIRANAACGLHFTDICVDDNGDHSTGSFTGRFGSSYTNDTGLEGRTFFTGSREFRVREIEVFEITS